MYDNKNNKKRHNPKSHAPAVYIPCWLIQVPHHELSYGAKLLYGRLAQWSNILGIVYRSCPQLSKELGMGIRTIERFINELKECGLIGTYQPQAGGLNHFEFYDHEWMYRSLNKELGYENPVDPPPNLAVPPPACPGGTPPPHLADINIKEIKENNRKRESSNFVDNFSEQDFEETMVDKKLSDESFDIFYSNYPRKKAENRARAAWYAQGCQKIFTMIMESLFKQIEHDDDFKAGYAPNADKYILEERWKDEPAKKTNSSSSSKVIYKSTQKYIADDSDQSWAENLHKDIL